MSQNKLNGYRTIPVWTARSKEECILAGEATVLLGNITIPVWAARSKEEGILTGKATVLR